MIVSLNRRRRNPRALQRVRRQRGTGTPEGVGAVVAGDQMLGSITGLPELRVRLA